MKEDNFYIGWQDDAPAKFKSKARYFFLTGLLITAVFIVIYVPSQQQMEASIFEYGTLTELEGQLVTYPVIGLKTTIGGENKTVPLVGFGKKGANAVIYHLVNRLDGDLSNYRVKLSGTIIRNNGKVWMELTEENESIISFSEISLKDRVAFEVNDLGSQEIYGEIVDPKCFFGVMKPGYGKIHRSCAIRCISGGIPPLLAIKKGNEYVDYYFLTNNNGTPLNQSILEHIGKKVRVIGQVEQVNDWKNIKLDENRIDAMISMNVDIKIAGCQ